MVDQLSLPIYQLKPEYDAIVIGSGYGGAIAASRLARAGRHVCLLERGREIQPGCYPKTFHEAAGQVQWLRNGMQLGSRTAMFDFHLHTGMSALVGCGLGGTSLINANVCREADRRVFAQLDWPRALQTEGVLDPYYALARNMLQPARYPTGEGKYLPLPKVLAHQLSEAKLAAENPSTHTTTFGLAEINVNFTIDGPNHVGTEQHPCVNCGNCVSGCNYGAKNTTLMNYLPDARNFGAEIFTQCAVDHLERGNDGSWTVHFNLGVERTERVVRAPLVVLAAGTMGTTGILLRSRSHGLQMSDQVGQRFSGNGDVLGFGEHCTPPIDGVGWRPTEPGESPPASVGPCIVSVIERTSEKLDDSWIIEDGSVPGALAGVLHRALHPPHFVDPLPAGPPDLGLLLAGGANEALTTTSADTAHIQTLLAMAHDGSEGVLDLDPYDRIQINWQGAGSLPVFAEIEEDLANCVAPLGGDYVPDPISTQRLGHNLITVHPLGGCAMADDASGGATNDRGQVFVGDAGTDVYEGLYVADGSLVPTSLGVNPLLTISALAERVVKMLAEDERGWKINYGANSCPPNNPAPTRPGLMFTERMAGQWTAEPAGPIAADPDTSIEFDVTIESDDLAHMLRERSHTARLSGTVSCPALSPNPLRVDRGDFHIFVSDPANYGAKVFTYRMRLCADTGDQYFLSGVKHVPRHSVLRAWHDTTTLTIALHTGATATDPLLGRGDMHMSLADFVSELATIQVTQVADETERLTWLERFGRFFVHNLWDQYGGVLSSMTELRFERPPRHRRQLRVGLPTVHDVETADGVSIRLTRYRGGDKGPVLIVHGLGVSSLIFTIDTIETNLVEYLCERGYDCWLLDYRCSVALPEIARRGATGDDVARFDYPAALAVMRKITGAEQVQVFAHCYGATTFTMALLGGFVSRSEVRSLVLSQISADIITPPVTTAKSWLRLPGLLRTMGLRYLDARAMRDEGLPERIYDEMLAAAVWPIAQGHCNDPVCHRITFIYGSLYRHDRIQQTHDVLHEMYGVAGLEQLQHLALMVRKGRVVAANGADSYYPWLERLALPTRIIQGADNQCYVPESTRRTLKALRHANPQVPYDRRLIRNYGHIDCIHGDKAHLDVYPYIAEHLDSYPLI